MNFFAAGKASRQIPVLITGEEAFLGAGSVYKLDSESVLIRLGRVSLLCF